MIDKTRSKNATSSAIRSAVLRDSHQRIKPVHRRKDTLMGVFYIRDIHRRIQGNNAGMRPPPHPGGEVFVFVLTSIICLPNQSVTQFLSGAPPFKKNPGSALNYRMQEINGIWDIWGKNLRDCIIFRSCKYREQLRIYTPSDI